MSINLTQNGHFTFTVREHKEGAVADKVVHMELLNEEQVIPTMVKLALDLMNRED